MELGNKKLIIDYFTHEDLLTSIVVFDLTERIKKFSEGEISEAFKPILAHAEKLQEFLLVAGQDKDFNIEPYERQALNLLDVKLFNDYLSLLKTGEQEKSEEFLNMEKEVEKQLYFISLVLGLDTPLPNIFPYEPEEIKTIFSDEKIVPYDHARFIRTLVEGAKDENNKELLQILMFNFGYIFGSADSLYNWEGALVFVLFCHLAYARFEFLSTWDQFLVVQNYFYRALVVGVPIRSAISAALYMNKTVVDYITHLRLLIGSLNDNTEALPLLPATGVSTAVAEKKISDFFKEYLEWSGKDWLNEKKQEEFIGKLYPVSNNDKLISWLKEILSIYLHISNGDLIKSTSGHELYPDEEFNNDIILLTTWFSLGSIAADDLIGYFKDKNKLVKLGSFIGFLKQIIDFDKESSVNNCLDFSNFLHEANLLPAEQELIVFHEADGKFHWNEDLKL